VVDPAEALATYVKEEAGLLVASLTRQLCDFDLAEEAVQDAILEALRRWPQMGVPREPGAWLRVTARHRAVNRLRREARHLDRAQRLARLEEAAPPPEEQMADDRLVLIFTCCHPAISRESQLALMLRSVLGLTTAQVAKALLTTEPTMAKRIVRAKRKIVDSGIPFAVPTGADLRPRLAGVLTAIYAMFNEGYLSAGPAAFQRAELADDAEWLASLLLQLLPGEPEVTGLLALMRLHQARRRARFDDDGGLVLMREQDRSLWNRAAITDAIGLLNHALEARRPGPYQVQAAITACHAVARRWEDTDWDRILRLYEVLVSMTDSPVAALNRAIAIQYRDGAGPALDELDELGERLASYHLFHAARAQMLRELGRPAEAVQADRAASRLTSNPAELQLLERRIGSAGGSP
jgi:RNA polymerase sigma-70 factor (ECF subfamily)